MADEAAVEGHTIDGHTVVVQGGIVYIDGVQATLGRTDINVFDVLTQFFDHLNAETARNWLDRDESDKKGDSPQPMRELPNVPDLPGIEVRNVEGEPSATIIINVGR